MTTGPKHHLRMLACLAVISVAAAGPARTPAIAATAAAAMRIPPPRDIAYPGTLRLEVDATDIARRIFRVRETIPVRPGQVTLLYPQWLPAIHAPAGRIDAVAGLIVSAGGRRLAWTRDPLNTFAIHVDVPVGAAALTLEFQYLSVGEGGGDRVLMTPEMVHVQWHRLLFYPAGYYVSRIGIEASTRLPAGWQIATALDTADNADGATRFRATTLETLVDSPLYAGRYFRRFDLGTLRGAPAHLNVFADAPAFLEATSGQIAAHRALLAQAEKLFGSRHFDHYDFLLVLSDRVGPAGAEHHQSSENVTPTGYFTDWEMLAGGRDLLPHEFVHSWNGKYRRPADLWTPNYNVPMQGSLLLGYEGLTQYYGLVLAARSGLITREQAIDELGQAAGFYANQPGRAWKSLQDTTTDPIVLLGRPMPWRSWQRFEDYYREGMLVWLDADTLIRQLSNGRRSLDDFARDFLGRRDGSHVPDTYTFSDLVRALNRCQPYDWATFLHTRLDSVGAPPPLAGIARGGYRLSYGDVPTPLARAERAQENILDLSYSLGLKVAADGRITDVLWEGPAFAQGLARGAQIAAVNGLAYNPGRLEQAVRDAQNGSSIVLLVRDGEQYRTLRIEYRAGLRYPRLERRGSDAASLDRILAPLG